MLESGHRLSEGFAQMNSSDSSKLLSAGWISACSVVNLRGDASDLAFQAAVKRALQVELPVAACSTNLSAAIRLVWVGPDDWFVLSSQYSAQELCARLNQELSGMHKAVTDVSGGYRVLRLGGKCTREILAQGCPLDLHPREFKIGDSAGSVFFKASIWLWQRDEGPTFDVLVRSSFAGYVWEMLRRCSKEIELIERIGVTFSE